ncbi:MAG: flippase-like domain-containing protein [Paludibacteraceae bacterium]|nr:flippase-like domain-containing protein [Paludibacteraceae bacterium]
MDKRRLIHIIKWGVAIAACGWLVWKLATYEDYAALGESLRNMGWQQWVAIGLCIALMPVNMALEAWRWQTLMKLPFRESQRQVYYSKLAGLITPWRLGEYPARALLLNDKMSAAEPLNERSQSELNGALWAKVLTMGAVGSATMTGAILIAGLLAIAVQPSIVAYVGGSYMYTVGGVMVLLTGVFFLMPKIFRQWADLHYGLLFYSLFQSFIRLVCWCVQLALVLYALGAISYQPSVISSLFIYYLLVTITPNVPVVEAGVRGAWAMMVFGTANAALAGVLLWGINTLLPCIVGLFLRKK